MVLRLRIQLYRMLSSPNLLTISVDVVLIMPGGNGDLRSFDVDDPVLHANSHWSLNTSSRADVEESLPSSSLITTT